ncbi:hypothetical protein DFH06DRAFT_1205418 [Mycena polygramma]|nr:hypothetical protein DFH06DRAFT_1205418 [Mycena polygramma]
MHPSLSPSSLVHLPPHLQTLATSATKGSHPDLLRLAFITREAPDSHRLLFLIAFYANLDPVEIPTGKTLDALVLTRSADGTAVGRACVSLVVLQHIPTPSREVSSDLWARAWPWMNFLREYGSKFADIGSEEDLYTHLMRSITHIQKNWDVKLISSTAGMRTLVGSIWVMFVRLSHPAGLRAICDFLSHDRNARDPGVAWRDEFVAGTDGLDHLASTVVGHIKHIGGNCVSPLPASRRPMLVHLIQFIGSTAKITVDLSVPDGPYEEALLEHGIISVLTLASCALTVAMTTEDVDLEFLGKTLALLDYWLLRCRDDLLVANAFVEGLLRLIILAAPLVSADMDRHFEFYLNAVLPPLMVNHRVLFAMCPDWVDLESAMASEAFRTSRIFPHWEKFSPLAFDRLRLLKHFRIGSYHVSRACDNVKCAQIQDRQEFKRCSGCGEMHYCSPECQTKDWKAGHRLTCKMYHSVRKAETLSTQDTAFLRALIQWDYEAARFGLYMDKAAMLAHTPGVPIFLDFDYTRGLVSITPARMEQEKHVKEHHPEWDDLVARVKASGGRMYVHRVQIQQKGRRHARLFRMRSNNSQIHDGLVALASTMPAPPKSMEDIPDEIVAGVRRLMEIEVVVAH